jgi:hypothetical protein
MSGNPLPPCNVRGRTLSRGRLVCHQSGRPEVIAAATCHLCPVVSLENAAKAHRLRLDMQSALAASQAIDVATRPQPVLDCPHRGPVIRQQEADLCGLRGQQFDVFHCGLHGECALGRFCQRQTVRSCAACIAAGQNRPQGGA